ncbi:MAG: hypothetical protein ABL907_09325, partial [Hyphomicrobium sp.]
TLANIITGNDVANVLNGGAGADTMAGVGGDDTFIVDDAGDTASGGAGTDTVQSSVTVTLGADVENLILTGAAAINGTGNSLANIIIGNAAANVIEGGTGLDSLDGGDGGDTYVFRPGDIVAGLVGRTIVDSGTTGTDTIRIDTSPGPSQTLSFRASAVAGLEAIAFTGGGIGVLRFNASQLSGPIDVAFSAANMQVIQILDATNFLGNTWTFSTPLYTSTSIEVFGTTAADTLTGTLSNDTLNGDGGADVLDGREGSDIYSYSQASDFVSGEFIKDTGTSGNDQLVISTVDYVAVDFTLASALSDFTTLETVYLGAEGSGAIFNASQVGLNWQIVDESSFQFIVINNATNINLQNWVFSNFEENGDTIYINGTGGGDTIIGTNKTDIITGGGGIDFLNGEAGIDFLAGGAAADILFGGLGDDEYLLDTGDLAAGEVIQDVFVQNVPLGGGFDTVKITGSGFFNFQLATLANIEQLTLAGSSLSIALKSSQAQQLSQINTTTLVQEFISVYLDSTSFDGSGITVVNWIPGSTDFDSFTIQGTASSDTISGTNVGEYIVGQGGADTIRGGGGADVLQGSGGADKFKYVSFAESTTGGIDMIQDFSGTGLDGDQIDLTDLVDGAIAFVGSGPFFGGSTPAVRYVDGATDRVVQCDADGNGTADLFITLEGQSGAAAMVSTDFLL